MQPEPRRGAEGAGNRNPAFLPLRTRMEHASWLFVGAGVLCFLGFALVAVGLLFPIPVVIAPSGAAGLALLSPYIAVGTILVGLGALLGFAGAAVKGPSREWDEIAPAPDEAAAGPEGIPPIRRCPNCGVHTWLDLCPECGHRMAGSPGA